MVFRITVAHFSALVFLCIGACASAPSAATNAKGQAAVHRYVAAEKHWRRSEYRLGEATLKDGFVVYEVIALADLGPSQTAGGGDSFWAYYDPRKDKVVNVLYGE
jgi:hypothetical protein